MEVLDLSALTLACKSLSEAVQDSKNQSFITGLSDSQKRLVVAGVIQNFEFCYELCVKMIKRQLEQDAAALSDIDQYSFRDLIRTAMEKGLLDDPELWFEFRRQRNITSHTSDQDKASVVYQAALNFETQALSVLLRLQQRNA